MRYIIIAVALLLTVTGTVAAEQVQWFPLVFSDAAHPPVVIDPTPMPTPTPTPVLVTIGCSQLPGYDGPVEYPMILEPETTYVSCFPSPGCRVGHVDQEGLLSYKCGASWCYSRAVLAGDITVLLPGLRLDNRQQDYWLVATREQCDGGLCVVMVARFLYPFEPGRLYDGEPVAATLPPDLQINEANGVGLWRDGIESWVTFWRPCTQYAGSDQPEQWSGRTLLHMGDDPGIIGAIR